MKTSSFVNNSKTFQSKYYRKDNIYQNTVWLQHATFDINNKLYGKSISQVILHKQQYCSGVILHLYNSSINILDTVWFHTKPQQNLMSLSIVECTNWLSKWFNDSVNKAVTICVSLHRLHPLSLRLPLFRKERNLHPMRNTS